MTAKEMIEFLQKWVKPDARIVINSIEEPEAGLVDIALIYNEDQVEIVEKMDD